MLRKRPIQILASSLIFMAGTAAFAASSSHDMHGQAGPNFPPAVAQKPDGEDLEQTFDRLSVIAFKTYDPYHQKARAYIDKVSNSARYPEPCQVQLAQLLVAAASGQSFADMQGKLEGDFEGEGGSLHLLDKAAFERNNMCKPELKTPVAKAFELADGFVSLIEKSLDVSNASDHRDSELYFSTHVGRLLREQMHTLPRCDEAVSDAIDTLDMLRAMEKAWPRQDYLSGRENVVALLARTAFKEDGACQISY